VRTHRSVSLVSLRRKTGLIHTRETAKDSHYARQYRDPCLWPGAL
jgi:hypothetical protein